MTQTTKHPIEDEVDVPDSTSSVDAVSGLLGKIICHIFLSQYLRQIMMY